MSARTSFFRVIPGLQGAECAEFEDWLLSYADQEDVMSSIMLEYEKMKNAGLARDTARYLYESAYETHVVPLDDAEAYFLFVRELANGNIISLGQSPTGAGELQAIALAYRRTCSYLGAPSLQGYALP